MHPAYETLAITQQRRRTTIAFNRPSVRNATNPLMHRELAHAFRWVAQDGESDVVVLTGAGDSFSAGGDLDSMVASVDDHARWHEAMQEARELLFALVDIPQPVIARINGHAVGLGATLALFCDITIAIDSARICDPHVKVGLAAGDGGALIWPVLIGYARAKEYLLTGEPIRASDAARLGLITDAVPADQLDARVDGVVDRLLGGARLAIRFTKQSLNIALRQQLAAVIDGHLGFETQSHLTADHREALQAFAARRDPRFTGT